MPKVTVHKIAREIMGKLQKDFAIEVKVPLCDLNEFENGKRILNPDQLERIEKALPRLKEVEALVKKGL